jgi:hypothetical protein
MTLGSLGVNGRRKIYEIRSICDYKYRHRGATSTLVGYLPFQGYIPLLAKYPKLVLLALDTYST